MVLAAANAKLPAMKSVHLVIPDLFLPQEFAAEVCAGLRLPALGKMLARGRSEILGVVTPESHLAGLFGLPAGAGIAALGAAFDGLGEGHWLRADPVHLSLQREQLVLLPEVAVSADEAAGFCASLNGHFAGQGMEFFAPHPQRWYVRLDEAPDIETVPLSQASGRNVRGLLPRGAAAMHWHRLFNEIQMLLFAHPANALREERGELPVNSVWLWGGGQAGMALQKTCGSAGSDEVLAGMFAAAAGVPFIGWPPQWPGAVDGTQLLVWNGLRSALQRGDLQAWRDALQAFEAGYAQPLWEALRDGTISQLQLDVPGGNHARRIRLSRRDTWAFWRRTRPLAEYSVV